MVESNFELEEDKNKHFTLTLPPLQNPPETCSMKWWRGILNRCFWKKPLALFLEEEKKETQVERTLGLFDLIMIGIGGTVGTGVFATAGLIASKYAGPAAILSWCIAGVGVVLSGLSFMELSTLVPASGSTYAYSYFALGEFPASISGFLLTLEYGVSSGGGARSWSSKFSAWLLNFNLETPSWMKPPNTSIDLQAGLLQLFCVLIVLCGMSAGKRFINVITLTKISVVLFIIIGGFINFRSRNFDPFIPPPLISPDTDETSAKYGWAGVMLGASASFYGYIGFDEVCCLAGEAKNPKRTIPLAIFGTILGASFLSIMATFSLVGMENYVTIDSEASFGKAFEHVDWNWAKYIVETGEVVTMPVTVLIGFLAQPRVQYAMAHDGLLPALFARVDRHGNPIYGTLISGVVITLIATFVPFEFLWDLISLGILLAFNLTNCSVILIRNRQSNRKNGIIGSLLLTCFVISSLVAAFSWQKGVLQHPNEIMQQCALFSSILSVCFMVFLWGYMCFSKKHHRNEGSINDDEEVDKSVKKTSGFRMIGMPFLPCLAIFFNWFLLAQMHWHVILIMLGYITAATLVYIVYGFHHSHSKMHMQTRQYEIVQT